MFNTRCVAIRTPRPPSAWEKGLPGLSGLSERSTFYLSQPETASKRLHIGPIDTTTMTPGPEDITLHLHWNSHKGEMNNSIQSWNRPAWLVFCPTRSCCMRYHGAPTAIHFTSSNSDHAVSWLVFNPSSCLLERKDEFHEAARLAMKCDSVDPHSPPKADLWDKVSCHDEEHGT